MTGTALREDLEAGSGSATALLRTVVGSVLRPIGGWMSAAGAVDLMRTLGVPAATARSSLTRLVARGVLQRSPRDGVAGYAIDPAAVPMLERRKIGGTDTERFRHFFLRNPSLLAHLPQLFAERRHALALALRRRT